MPIDLWGPWRDADNQGEGRLADVKKSVESMFRPEVVLDILQNFTLFCTDKKHRRIKVICRYQQYEGTNLIVERVVKARVKKGLIWHFQGSGKSLLMVFTAQKLRMHPLLENPAVLIVVDRIDLDTQITATFNAADVPNMVKAETREELETLLAQDVRKVIITTIHKFGEAEGVLNDRKNIIVMVDEAHRTQEGDLGRKMRTALPKAFLFGLTGTPINRIDKNTFWAFGADEDEKGYLSRYTFQESIRDKATLPLHFESPEIKLKIAKAAIDEAYKQITGSLNEQDRDDLAKRAAKMAVLVKTPERVRGVVQHIVTHYEADYRWLTQVYESVKPPSGNGKLLWHVLGAKTIELIHQNVHLDTVHDDIETLVMDAEVLESVLGTPDPKKKGKTLEINLIARLRRHGGNPKFVALGDRLERIREKHEQGLIDSREFLKQLLELARDVLEAEKEVNPVEEQDKAKAALTELFQQVKTEETPVIVERIVNDIDEIVRMVRFPGWQSTSAGEREVQKALRRTLLKYHLHKDQELFDRAYGYIRQYY
jgi:hypothetical protein